MELPGLSLNLSALGEDRRPDPDQTYDVLILGGGPAAMAAAVYAARKLLQVALVTKDFGGQVAWTSEIENYLGFQLTTGRELTDRFVEQVRTFKIPTAQGETIAAVRRAGERFEVGCEGGAIYRGRVVILATGKRDRPLGVPGEQELVGRGVAYCATCDAPFYKGKRVLVVGGGNSAATAVLDLHKVGAAVSVVNLAADWKADAILVEEIARRGAAEKVLHEHQVTRIEGGARVTGVKIKSLKGGKLKALKLDGVFVEIGLLPNSDPVRELARLNLEGEVMIDCQCRTSVPGLFAAGDVTTVPHKQIIISAGEGAKAALSAYDHLTRQPPWPEEINSCR